MTIGDDAVRRAVAARYEGGGLTSIEVRVAVEEPLEIRIADEPLAVTMRTPGHDEELALGFLFAEGVVGRSADVGSIAHCGHPGDEGWGNVVNVLPAAGTALDPERRTRARRSATTTSACGVCGRKTIDDLLAGCREVRPGPTLAPEVLVALPDLLRTTQTVFSATGGSHAAALCTSSGELVVAREDVGRHNAVDKVIGRWLLDGASDPSGLVLVVSGRSSFEVVQKAARAGVPTIVSVSAPSSLAVDLANRAGILLVGFTRAGAFTAYAHAERLAPAPGT